MLRTPASLSGYPTSTWAGLPAAASAQGQIVRVTDFGIPGVGLLVISDATRWAPLGPQVLARSGAAASVTGTLAKTVLATASVPGGLLGASGQLRAWPVWSCTNNANTKSGNVDFGGLSVASQGLASVGSTSALFSIRNRTAGSQTTWVGSATGLGSVAGSGLSSTAVDTSANQSLTISGTLTNVADTVTLESYVVEVLP